MSDVHTPLEVQASDILTAISSYPDAWLRRAEIARAMGKGSLNPGDLVLLQWLVEQGRIEVREEATTAPSGKRYEYRLITR